MFKYYVNPLPNSNVENKYLSDISYEVIDHWIENFERCLPSEFKMYFKEALIDKHIYHSNIFTMRKDICNIYFPILNYLINDIISFVDDNNIVITNKRWLGFLIEYLFSNIFFHMLVVSKKFKFMHCQLLV